MADLELSDIVSDAEKLCGPGVQPGTASAAFRLSRGGLTGTPG